MALKIRRRSRLRRKDVTDLLGRLSNEFGMNVPEDVSPIDEAEAGPQRLVLRAGEIVWVRDEKNRRALAVGQAIMDGPTMAREEKGKAIQTLHHVGDDLWRLGEEEA